MELSMKNFPMKSQTPVHNKMSLLFRYSFLMTKITVWILGLLTIDFCVGIRQ